MHRRSPTLKLNGQLHKLRAAANTEDRRHTVENTEEIHSIRHTRDIVEVTAETRHNVRHRRDKTHSRRQRREENHNGRHRTDKTHRRDMTHTQKR